MPRAKVILDDKEVCFMTIRPHDTVATLKKELISKLNLRSGILELISCTREFSGNNLVSRSASLTSHLIYMRTVFNSATVFNLFGLSSYFLVEPFNYDFTYLKEDGRRHTRGGKTYDRPYGWFRFALRVKNTYRSSGWLEGSRPNSCSSQNGWPVSYHGTKSSNISSIVQQGYKLSRCIRHSHGCGIYSSPSINIAEYFAEGFTHEGKRYKVVLQNRVNPQSLREVHGSIPGFGNGARFWISAQEADIRPYGILIKQVGALSDLSRLSQWVS